VKDHLPEPALYMIRYHSFYAWHREGEYGHLLDEHDRRMLSWVQQFNPYDLYSKSPVRPDWERLRPYYTALIDRYLPGTLRWYDTSRKPHPPTPSPERGGGARQPTQACSPLGHPRGHSRPVPRGSQAANPGLLSPPRSGEGPGVGFPVSRQGSGRCRTTRR